MVPYKTGPWTAAFFLLVVLGGTFGGWLGYPLLTTFGLVLAGFLGLVYYYYRRSSSTT